MRAAGRVAAGGMTLLLLFSAAVQYNDPDPAGWMAIYLAAALASGLEASGRLRWPLAALVAAIAAAWAITLAPGVVGQVDFMHAFRSMGMSGDPREEEAREMTGLLIVAGWCGALAVVSRKRTAAPT
jgi:hypothetical protein